jgi:transposase-like protein
MRIFCALLTVLTNSTTCKLLVVLCMDNTLQNKRNQQHATTFPTAKMQSHRAGRQRILHDCSKQKHASKRLMAHCRRQSTSQRPSRNAT